jgi:RimJ/RimL family protein N-acetyltransferase
VTLFLHTARLRLRFHDLEDLRFMLELNADPEVTRFTGDGPVSGEEEARANLERLERQAQARFGRMVVLDRESGERLGWCGLKHLEGEGQVDLGYRFLRRHWGKGYATEAARASLAFGFEELALTRVVAGVAEGNVASLGVLRKLGFRSVGAATIDGEVLPAFELTREAWSRGPGRG